MNEVEIIAVIFILLIYCIIGAIVACSTYNKIARGGFVNNERILSTKNMIFAKRNEKIISVIVGIMWLFMMVFLIWYDWGGEIYNRFIIKDDEESRIAPWVV